MARSAVNLALPRLRSSPTLRFVESLAEVASVVSSRSTSDEVVRRVVDEAKTLVRCRKALVWIFEDGQDDLAGPRIVVRGSREQYPEIWWRPVVEAAAVEVCETRRPVVRRERAQDASVACLPIGAPERTIGLLVAINSFSRSFSESQLMLLAVLGTFAGVAIENGRLRAQSEHALLAGERSRIAKEMHDGLAQSLFSASLGLEVCKRTMRSEPDRVEEKLSDTQLLLSESLTELRRYIYDLRPVRLDRLGLAGALSSKMDEIVGTSTIEGTLRVEGAERPVTPSAEACLYRVLQESLANALKHSQASSVLATVTFRPDSVELLVHDDGQGFDVAGAEARCEDGRSLGLRNMRGRVAGEGGEFSVDSRPGSGTSVWVTLPC